MDKQPVLFRTLVALVVVAVFAWAMHPLTQRDYYEVFTSLLKKGEVTSGNRTWVTANIGPELVRTARELQAKDPTLFQSQALLTAADNAGVNLADLIEGKGLTNNRDAISLIRKKASGKIRLGLDLNGGVEFYLKLVADAKKDPKEAEEIRENFDHYRDVAIETLRKRLEGQNIFEAELAPSGAEHIVLRAPIVTNDEKAKLRDLIQMSAKLEFRLVEDGVSEAQLLEFRAHPEQVAPGLEYMEYTDIDVRHDNRPVIRRFLVERRPQMDGRDITLARAIRDEMGQKKITLRFNDRGAADFKRVTENNVGRQLAIVLDGRLYCAPVINGPIPGGSAEISGSFTDEEVKTIADALTAGGFPYTIEVSAMFDTDPKLGAASVRNGIVVGLISLLAVALFMIVYYRFSGLIAVAALILNMILILGAMAAFDCTLTLPGIAGIVLTIGMAVDANVLIHERIREERLAGRDLRPAVTAGYDRALTAVLDSNITTLITGVILMNVGTGAIKGFAVTLTIGILTTLFSAVFVTRLIYDYLLRYTAIDNLPMMRMFRRPDFDFVRFWKFPLIFSGLLALLLVVIFAVRGRNVLNMDFTGGTAITYSYTAKVNDTAAIAAILVKGGYTEPSVTYKSNITGGSDAEKIEIMVRNGQKEGTAADIAGRLNKSFPQLGIKAETASIQQLDGLIGAEFTKAAILAVVLAFIGIGLYIVLRYEWTFACAGVLALLHDLVVCLAIYLLTGNTIGLTAVAAFLTVIGYSINDTVVIFDRIRENRKLHPALSFDELTNLSVNQTLSRTMLTSITTFIVVFILFVAGGPEIHGFVWIMMLGVIFGTYSSVFLAGPFVAWQLRMRTAKARR